MESNTGQIWIISGPRSVGKTRFCSNLIKKARKRGYQIEGLICPPSYAGNEKTAIEIENLKTGEHFILATARDSRSDLWMTERWIFDPEVLKWGDQVLGYTGFCDLLVIDELGPLEFTRGEGWQNGFLALDKRNFKTALVVIRPELLTEACIRWPDAKIIEIVPMLDKKTEAQLQNRVLSN